MNVIMKCGHKIGTYGYVISYHWSQDIPSYLDQCLLLLRTKIANVTAHSHIKSSEPSPELSRLLPKKAYELTPSTRLLSAYHKPQDVT